MQKTFLVAIEVDDTSDLDGLAEEMKEVLGVEGFTVRSVHPWQPHGDASVLLQPFKLPDEDMTKPRL